MFLYPKVILLNKRDPLFTYVMFLNKYFIFYFQNCLIFIFFYQQKFAGFSKFWKKVMRPGDFVQLHNPWIEKDYY